MRQGLTSTDRRLLLSAVALLLLLIAGAAVLAPPGSEAESPVPSIYSTSPGGARAGYLLLRDLGFDVRVLEDPPATLAAMLPSSARDSLLILAEPIEAPAAADRAALARFVEAGGHVLFCGAVIPAFFNDAKVRPPLSGRSSWILNADLPGAISRGADHVTMRAQTWWGTIEPSQLRLYSVAGNAGIVSWRVGAGEVLWWASASPLTNAGLKQTGNLALFINTMQSLASRSVPIYWDEYFHGQRTSLSSYILKTPAKWAGWQFALIAALVLFSFSRRSGPVVTPPTVSRLSPLEFVDTMGALYRHAHAFSIPVEVSYRNIRLELTQRLGLPAATPDEELARIAAQRLGGRAESPDGTELAAALAAAAPGSQPAKPSSRQALALVQRLETLLTGLTAPAFTTLARKEKN
jgi:hypothetical protein